MSNQMREVMEYEAMVQNDYWAAYYAQELQGFAEEQAYYDALAEQEFQDWCSQSEVDPDWMRDQLRKVEAANMVRFHEGDDDCPF